MFGSVLLSALKIGMTLDIFSLLGKTPFWIQVLNILVKGTQRAWLTHFSKRTGQEYISCEIY